MIVLGPDVASFPSEILKSELIFLVHGQLNKSEDRLSGPITNRQLKLLTGDVYVSQGPKMLQIRQSLPKKSPPSDWGS